MSIIQTTISKIRKIPLQVVGIYVSSVKAQQELEYEFAHVLFDREELFVDKTAFDKSSRRCQNYQSCQACSMK